MLANLKWKISSKWKRFQSAKLWQNINKGQVKLFTYFVIGLILCVIILQLTLIELDKKHAARIASERDHFMQRHASPSILSRAHSDKSMGGNSVVDHFLQRFKYNHTSNGNISDTNNKSPTVKRHVNDITKDGRSQNPCAAVKTTKPQNRSPPTMDPFEVSESQFVVYRERHRTVGNSNGSTKGYLDESLSDDLEAAAAAATQTSYITNSRTPLIDVSHPIRVNHSIDTKNISHMKRNNQDNLQNQTNSTPASARSTTESTTAADTLVDAATAGALAGAFIGDHMLSQFEQKDEEPTATGTNHHQWAGHRVDSQPESTTAKIDESSADNNDISDEIPPPYTSKLERSGSDQDDISSSTIDSIPDSIESLMGLDDKDDLTGDSNGGQANQSQDSNLVQARSNLRSDSEANPTEVQVNDDGDLEDDDLDNNVNLSSIAPNDAMRIQSPLNYQANEHALQTMSNQLVDPSSHDLKTAYAHHYGKKKKKKKIIIKKKKKKKKKVYKVKKVKKVKKKVIKKKKKKKKVIIIKKKKHHKPDHGKYYMYAKVPKKKSWEFGFKKGNKKHWIERHEKGHKNKFKTKVKWYDKKSKGKGVHIWDYNHHDKKKKHYG